MKSYSLRYPEFLFHSAVSSTVDVEPWLRIGICPFNPSEIDILIL